MLSRTPPPKPSFELQPSMLLYMDALGARSISTSQEAATWGARFRELIATVTHSNGLDDPNLPHRVKWFSDNLAFAWPFGGNFQPHMTIGMTVNLASHIQTEFVWNAVPMRGAITVGMVHMDDDFVFGDALGEADHLEKAVAVYPRVVLSDDVAALYLDECLSSMSNQPDGYSEILWDDEGVAFVNYMHLAFEEDEDRDYHVHLHQRFIEWNLAASSRHPRVHDKYRWLAQYHNFMVGKLYRKHYQKRFVVRESWPTVDFVTSPP